MSGLMGGDGGPPAEGYDWSDITPIPQDDGANPVVAINYSPHYREAMDRFRAILAKDELSARALDLTDTIVDINAAHYTAWQYRRRCLAALNSNLHDELRYVEEKAYDSPKNYQIWFHRRAIVKLLGDPGAELAFVANVLSEDGKNYHAWSHRQWVLRTFSLWDGELQFLDIMLQSDVRNNSAWNQRWFVVENTTGFPAEIVTREVEYAFGKIDQAVDNESPWNYVRGLMRTQLPDGERGWQFTAFPAVKERCLAMRATEAGADCVPMLGLLLDMFQSETQESPSNPEPRSEACAIIAKLMEVDSVRKPYWARRQGQLDRLQPADATDATDAADEKA